MIPALFMLLCQSAKKLKIINNPRNFVAQPLIRLSTSPTIIKSSIQPRHIDLRPFILSSKKTFITNGGLTRVALKKGSTIAVSYTHLTLPTKRIV